MWENINKEIKNYCKECKCKDCKKYDCLAYRIKCLLGCFFDYEKVNIDVFFKKTNEKQLSLFNLIGGDNE